MLMSALNMAAIGRFQKGDEIFYAKCVDGELFRLQGDVFGSPSFEKKPVPSNRSINCIKPAAVKTGRANACKMAVMNMAQIASGKRNIVMPGARIWMMVVM